MGLQLNVSLKNIVRSVEAEKYRDAIDQFTQIFQNPTAKISENLVDDILHLLMFVFSKITILERAVFAKAVSRSKNLPEAVVRRLLKESPAVSSHMILLAPFTDEELIDLIARGDITSRLTITERANLTEPVTDQLVTVGELPVLVGLARNATAKLSRRSFDVMAGVAADDEDLDMALSSRADLPLDIATRLSRRGLPSSEERMARMLEEDLAPRRSPLSLGGSGI